MNRLCLASFPSVCLIFVFSVLAPVGAQAQQSQARIRIVSPVDDAKVITLQGNTHPLARAQFDQGPAPDDLPARRMLLLLSRTPEQQAALDKFVEEQHSADSANYRHWLTPAELGSMFGPADADLQAVTGWLQGQGFNVGRISASKTVIEFSGSAGQIRQAFHTQLHKYVVNGEEHWANAQDPQIPAALAPVVRGLVSLNNFRPRPQSHRSGDVFVREADGTVKPALTVTSASSGTTYYALGPADFATIYSTSSLLQAGNKGAGETIAVIGESNVNLQDVADFRNMFGLGSGKTSVVIDGPDPGIVPLLETEADLDLEWANAVAPDASVILVTAQGTETTSGIELAALRAVESNLADVMSVSFIGCEAQLGTTGNQFFKSLWEQAAAEGITVVVAAGDDGSAGCDNQNVEFTASRGFGVNGLASTAFNVAVGGTDFNDASTQSLYWNATNPSPSLGTAKSYIPETTWNETCAAMASAGNLGVCPALPASGTPPATLNLWAGSGGASSVTSKPAWQTGAGVPQDGSRDLPDVSFFSATGASGSHSFYVVCEADMVPGFPSCQLSTTGTYFLPVGGTSVAAPSFAAIVALADQKAGTRLGNVNYFLYSLAAGNGASCASTSGTPGGSCIFNDIVTGNNSVPCQAGSANCSSGGGTGVMITGTSLPAFTATAGYDLATGLGSVNATNFVNAIVAAKPAATTSTTLTLNGSANSVSVQHGTRINVGVSVSPSTAGGDVALMGGSGAFDFGSLAGGTANWSSSLFPGGAYSVKAHYAGDGTHQSSDSNDVAVSITPEASKTFVNLVSFDPLTAALNFTASSVPYGSPYVLRVDVTNSGGSVSSTKGVSSTCSSGTASCPTGTVTVASTGSFPYGTSFALNSQGYGEDQLIQLPAGSYMLSATYPGDPSYSSSTGTKTVTVTKAQTSTSVSSLPSATFQYGTPAPINAAATTTSSGVSPTGSFAFTDNGAAIPAPPIISFSPQAGGATGHAGLAEQISYVPQTVGNHNLSAQYSGDQNYLSSSTAAPLSFTVTKANVSMSSPAISAAAAPNEQVVISVTMLSTSRLNAPTGAVAFIDNGSPISGTPTITAIDGAGSSSAGFTAKMPVTLTQAGMHTLSISYAGDGNYNPITQNIGTVDVTTTALAVALPPGASQVTLPPTGGSGSAPITLFDSMSSSMTVTLSCKPDSTAATCSVNPATVNVQPNSITTLATVSYTVPALTGRLHPALPFELPFVFAGVLAGFACSKRRKGTLAFLLLAAALAMSMASCGGGGGHNSTPNVSSNPSPRVYNFTVTAVAGSNSDSKTITVTVQ